MPRSRRPRAGVGATTAGAQSSPSHREAANATLPDAPTGFSVVAPIGYRLRVASGVYRITGGGVAAGPEQEASGARCDGHQQRNEAQGGV